MKKTVLIVDDEQSFRKLYSQTIGELDIDIITASSGEEAVNLINNFSPDMVISDVRMLELDGITLLKTVKKDKPELPFLLITAYANIRDAVNSLKLGAVDYLEKPVDLDELKSAVSDTLNLKNITKAVDVPKEVMDGIIAESSVIRNLYSDAYRVAESDITILITGESGVGKEVLAQFIHDNSSRRSDKLVTLNCASIPRNILNSELFGHIKGAFTGAVSNRAGKFREADKGSLFLDEIGDMPIELQASLLRVLENSKISPVGSDKEEKVDVRLIAATNKSLDDEIVNGNFREDLYYRLNVITLEIPPLRERQEDIIPLARYFLKADSCKKYKRLSSYTARILQNYSWPGNIRELSNAMKRAKILSRTELIMPEHLPQNIRNNSDIKNYEINLESITTLEKSEISSIRAALEKMNGNQTKTAELLGISRRTLINKIKKYNL
ncbi:MAG TPA: sigma-54 dependent transcriptional regulator [Victivallales bacterium]|nr:sigma-54 dependent transcriptional regulator [Victivallales bacterium]